MIMIDYYSDFLHVAFPPQSTRGPPRHVFYSFKKWEISFVKCSNSGNLVFCYSLIILRALCDFLKTNRATHFTHYGAIFFLGSAPLGPARPGAGEEVPRCDPGLLHNPLLLRRAQRRLHCQR